MGTHKMFRCPNKSSLRFFSSVLMLALMLGLFLDGTLVTPFFQLQSNSQTEDCAECDTDDNSKVSVTTVFFTKKNFLSPALDIPDVFSHSSLDGIQSPPEIPPKTPAVPIHSQSIKLKKA